MPTGYTADIAKGITFKEYALSCARNFGALILMRDETKDAPIPDAFEPSDYHSNALKKAEDRIRELRLMSSDEVAKAAITDHHAQVERHREAIAEKAQLKGKYQAMLDQVKAYTPPSPDHENFKKFMVSQIEESIEFDCGGTYHENALRDLSEPMDPCDWLDEKLAKAREDAAYHDKNLAEEVKRTAERNRWVRQLRASLSGEGVNAGGDGRPH